MSKLLAGLLLVSMPAMAIDLDKVNLLHYRFNKDIIITISNITCPYADLPKKYTRASVAEHSSGKYIAGCYALKGDNEVEIKWRRGDVVIVPGEGFLKGDKGTFEPKATL